MFEMLDYRARNLYLLIFGLPNLFLLLVCFITPPILTVYLVNTSLTDDKLITLIIKIITSLISVSIIEILVQLLWTVINKINLSIFTFFIDVEPSNNFSKSQSLLVVKHGFNKIKRIAIANTHPSQWTHDDMELLYHSYPWYNVKQYQRVDLLHRHFYDQSIEYNDNTAMQLLKTNNLELSKLETLYASNIWMIFGLSVIRHIIALYFIIIG